jgi:hypothetical protein
MPSGLTYRREHETPGSLGVEKVAGPSRGVDRITVRWWRVGRWQLRAGAEN